MTNSRFPCGEPAEWRPIAEPLCREMRSEWKWKRFWRFAGSALVWLIIAATLAMFAVVIISGAGK